MTKTGQALRLLHHAPFRAFILARLILSMTLQMRTVARGWLVYDLTGSALALTGVTTAQGIAMLALGPVGGVLCDRLDRRAILLCGRGIQALNNLGLAILVLSGNIQVWHLGASALLDGLVFAFTMPAQISLIPDLVPGDQVTSGFAVLAIVRSTMGIVGATLAGQLVDCLGAGMVFLCMAALYVVADLFYLRLPLIPGHNVGQRTSVLADLRQGVDHVRDSSALVILLGLAFAYSSLVIPYRTLLPALAADRLGMSAKGLGWLASVNLLGGLAASVLLSARQGGSKSLLLSGVATGMALGLFCATRRIPAAFVFIALAGAASQGCEILNTSLTQTLVRAEYRGRVASLKQVLYGLAPAVHLPSSALADSIGVSPVVAVQAAAVIAIYGGVWFMRPQFRNRQ